MHMKMKKVAIKIIQKLEFNLKELTIMIYSNQN